MKECRLMMIRLLKKQVDANDLLDSVLFDEKTFYKAFVHDLKQCAGEAIVESPFITSNRVASLLPIFRKMRSRGVKIIINTRHPAEHDTPFAAQAGGAIEKLQAIGVQVLFTGAHHRKIAILDRKILWEGSLNILSQHDSCEIMRRIKSKQLAAQMLEFIKLSKFLR
jgi:phosphatidylserine/phosphatidylglycerophosphate/cardiolipin synthase-like enzyme